RTSLESVAGPWNGTIFPTYRQPRRPIAGPVDNLDSDSRPLRFGSLLDSEEASQRGKERAVLSCVATIPTDPASHPNQLASRNILAIVGDAPGGGIPALPPEIGVWPVPAYRVAGAAA